MNLATLCSCVGPFATTYYSEMECNCHDGMHFACIRIMRKEKDINNLLIRNEFHPDNILFR